MCTYARVGAGEGVHVCTRGCGCGCECEFCTGLSVMRVCAVCQQDVLPGDKGRGAALIFFPQGLQLHPFAAL